MDATAKEYDPRELALLVAEYMDFFSGDRQNYGVHQYNFVDGGKESGKNHTEKNRLLTMEQYKAHINGELGLGVIPIDDKGETKFGVIDIDVYDSDLTPYLLAIERVGFPLVPFRSKSGGVHLYMFLNQPENAKAVIDLMNTMSSILGLDAYIKRKLNRIVEVFPKQSSSAQKAVGSWINMPYYNALNTRQYAMKDNKALSLAEALAYCKERRRSITEVREFLANIAYQDGPPCLQTLYILGIMGDGMGRNNYLFSFGVFLKKKDPEFWEQKLFEANDAMAEPLTRDELETSIVSSLRKKDYMYKCKEAPCVDFCKKSVCRTRDFGIGKDGGYFSEVEFGRLRQFKSYEPYYEWEVKLQSQSVFSKMRFKNENDIIGQDAFLRLCVRDLHRLPAKIKQFEWCKTVNQALLEMEIVEIDQADDTTPIGLFKILFTEFLTERAMAQTKEQILNKRVWLDERTGTYYFRATDLSEFIFVTKAFRYFDPAELHGLLKDFGAVGLRLRTEKGRQIRVYSITQDALQKIGFEQAEPFVAEFKKEEEDF